MVFSLRNTHDDAFVCEFFVSAFDGSDRNTNNFCDSPVARPSGAFFEGRERAENGEDESCQRSD